MSADSYSVVCDLDLRNFDNPRLGRAAARNAFAEVRRLARNDGRVRSTKLRRGAPLLVEIPITVQASNSWEAFDLGRAIVRTAVHTIGGSTAGSSSVDQTSSSSRRFGSPSTSTRYPSSTAHGWTRLLADQRWMDPHDIVRVGDAGPARLQVFHTERLELGRRLRAPGPT